MFRLALALGRTVAEIEQSMSASELVEWMEFSAREPFGANRENIHFAMLCALIANVNRGKNTQPFKPQDFMLVDPVEQKAKQQSSFLAFLRANSKPSKG